MMKHLVIFIWVVCGLAHLASGQSQACTNAILALSDNTECFNALTSTNANATLICNGTCRSLFNRILNDCRGEVKAHSLSALCIYGTCLSS